MAHAKTATGETAANTKANRSKIPEIHALDMVAELQSRGATEGLIRIATLKSELQAVIEEEHEQNATVVTAMDDATANAMEAVKAYVFLTQPRSATKKGTELQLKMAREKVQRLEVSLATTGA
jgi:hypothetical protein